MSHQVLILKTSLEVHGCVEFGGALTMKISFLSQWEYCCVRAAFLVLGHSKTGAFNFPGCWSRDAVPCHMNQEFHYTWWHVYLVCGCLELSEVLSRPPNGPFSISAVSGSIHIYCSIPKRKPFHSYIYIYIFFLYYLFKYVYIYIERDRLLGILVACQEPCMPSSLTGLPRWRHAPRCSAYAKAP